ncbi:hypothetical protein SSS_05544 [Sarcoptes scabiei]|nr:hypothetical protein SSS_05544 [Sarcoptes scabiei]
MPFSMFGIEFAPLRIPLERRKQTAAVLYYWTEFFLTGPLMIMFLLYLYTTRFYHLVYLYLIWRSKIGMVEKIEYLETFCQLLSHQVGENSRDLAGQKLHFRLPSTWLPECFSFCEFYD